MPTTIKEALAKWEEKSGQKAAQAQRVELWGQIPPIEKMDNALSPLINCERLSLSTNNIDKIANLQSLKNLTVLSLGRNNIKVLTGIETTADSLQELWISYNLIEKLKGINVLKKLKVLYISYNLVKEWGEFMRLNELPALTELVFIGNPLYEKHTAEEDWAEQVASRLKVLKKLDGFQVIREIE